MAHFGERTLRCPKLVQPSLLPASEPVQLVTLLTVPGAISVLIQIKCVGVLSDATCAPPRCCRARLFWFQPRKEPLWELSFYPRSTAGSLF